MIDWFVLLTPLALLPIFLLFVFIGCVLDSSGLGTEGPITFTYGPGLDENSLVLTITVSIEYQDNWYCPEKEGESTFWNVPPPDKVIVNIDPNGGKELLGIVKFVCSGTIECHCTITGTGSVQSPVYGEKYKNEDDVSPTFHLSVDENGNLSIT